MYALAALVDWLAASPLKSDCAKQAADQVSALPASYLQPFFGSAVQCQANSQILATVADFQFFLGEHLIPPEWVYLPRERLGIDISGTGRTVNGPIGNYQTFIKQTLAEQGNWPSILRSFSQLQAKETQTVYGFECFLRTQGAGTWLFYEEPELAVHPVDQVSLAQLQYQLFRHGVKQVVATDSDYYLKALINEVLAARLTGDEVSQQIIVYDCSAGKIRPCWQLFQEGIVDSFDDVTNAVNRRYYQLYDQLDDSERD